MTYQKSKWLSGLLFAEEQHKVGWTFKGIDYVEEHATWNLEGVGYKRSRKVEGKLRKPFVPKNMRASNEYRDCTNCIYTINIYPHGSLESHLRAFGIVLDRDLYALSEVVQFIFRGSIREHKDMYLYILSDRMRTLVSNWLQEDY